MRQDIHPVLLCGGRIAYAVAHDIGVTVFTDFDWTDALATQYIEECIAVTKKESELGGRGGLTYLVSRPPGATQRRIIVDALARAGVKPSLRSVIVSSSMLVRGAATALGWLLGNDTRVFAPKELAAAAAYAAFDDPPLTTRVLLYTRRCLTMVGLTPPAR